MKTVLDALDDEMAIAIAGGAPDAITATLGLIAAAEQR